MDSQCTHEYEDWYNQIAAYDRSFKKWEGRADKIVKRYRDDSRLQNNPQSRFNILWSNVQTIIPAIFARLPRPDVSRRFRDNDPTGRVACMLLERALEFELEHYSDYKSAMKNSVFDRLMGGRGTAWVRYEPHIAAKPGTPDDGYQLTEDVETDEDTEGRGEDQGQEEIEYECAPIDYVHWRDFGHTVARTWEEVTAVWRKVYMNRNALVERFGEDLGYKIPLDTKPEESKSYAKNQDMPYQACIYEIWDKETEMVVWISKSMGVVLDERDDPLELEGFFPCPKPLYSTMTTDNLEPIPDYAMYQDQARELDTLADRIDGLINALKVRGVYDASSSELQRLFSEGENNTLIPVKNWAAFAEKQGMRGAIDLVDIAPFANALMSCYQAMDQVKGQIYEIMGIADIQRGQTDPNETLGAQIIKSNNAAGRLKTMQHDVVDFATKLLQLKAQIICNHFTPETIVKISGAAQLSEQDQMRVPQALQLLKNQASKNFRIEVTTDSMIFQDEQQEKADRVAFLSTLSQFMTSSMPIAQNVPELTPLLMEMLKFGVTAFKVGKQMEGMIDDTADKFREQAKQMEGQQKPPPVEIQKVQIQSQAKIQEMQASAQIEQQKLQMQMEVEKSKQEAQAQENLVKNQLELERSKAEMASEMELEKHKLELAANKDLLLAYVDNASKLEAARISAGMDDGSAAYQYNLQQASILQDQMGYSNMTNHPLQPVIENMHSSNQQMTQLLAALIDKLSQPKQVMRDENGKIVGVA
ncbi:hypothetical protein UFOVP20_35 [uncultured Caudovirales phage]|uniref:Portal protein n=1 Tax=uncultured Caudovirales phage TaxID=2100421 RepID=A0A6J5KLE2_9CAUD|nr:hypothetical protein UFOVP20_35 [uncultured Caudovirales phage]